MQPIRVMAETWPLVVSWASGLCSLEDHVAYLEAWQGWFARAETFAVLRVFEDEDALVHPDGAAQATKAWLRDGASDAIRRQVRAMVNVVPASAHERLSKTSIEQVFGVPGLVCSCKEEAIDWLQDAVSLEIDWARVELAE